MSLFNGLLFSAILFSISLAGIFLNRKNIILLLICLELMLLSISTNFIVFSKYGSDLTGQLFVFFILTVAAAEAAIGLALVVVYYRTQKTIAVDAMQQLKG